MSARELLRALAARLDGDTYLHDAPEQAAALRALADRLDMALAGRGGPVLAAMRRLDADITPRRAAR